MLISEDYRQAQATLHENPDYGVASRHFAKMVSEVINRFGVTELLDYGAGKCRLIQEISEKRLVAHPFDYRAYEPSDPRLADTPEPAEMVACIDVLEHIEPDCLEDVLDDLQRVTQWAGFFTVSTVLANKTLPDGRNAHLIVRPMEWWLPKLMARWELHMLQRTDEGFVVLMRSFNVDNNASVQ